jgi:hypothetical protein
MSRFCRWATVAVGLVLLPASVLLAQTKDPYIGVWKLNVAASKYDPGPAPKESARTVEDWGGGLILVTGRGTDAQGNPTWGDYVFRFDGRDYPYASSPSTNTPPGPATISYKRIDASTFENTVKRGGKVTGTNAYTVSKDGKTLTQRQKSTNAQGQPANNVLVWERQ